MITDPLEFRQKLQDIQNSIDVTFTHLPSDEPRFIIDADTRTINIPYEFAFLSVKNDHKAETIYFEIDRYFDDVDLSEHTCVVQFMNKSNEGIYPVTTMDITTVDGKIIFGWEIMNDATQLAGDLQFAIRFYSIGDDNKFTYNFNTLTAKSTILDTLDVTDSSSADITSSEMQAWIDRMNEIKTALDTGIDDLNKSTKVYTATCDTDMNTAAKIVTTTNGDFKLENGAVVNIYLNKGIKPLTTGMTFNIDGTEDVDFRPNGADDYDKSTYTSYKAIFINNNNLQLVCREISAGNYIFELASGANVLDVMEGFFDSDRYVCISEIANDIDSKADKNNVNIYSTTPVQVGTWIDGTPVWRITFQKEFDEEDRKDKNFGVDLNVIDENITFIINAYACSYIDGPNMIDGYFIPYINYKVFGSDFIADASKCTGAYGWIEFVTPESNIETETEAKEILTSEVGN